MKLVVVFAFLLGLPILSAAVRLPVLFSQGMVLQRERPIPVWGWANPEENVVVSLADKSASTKADEKGHWKVNLPAMPAGGPYILKANDQQRQDVYVGEVWLCSGQSNMEFHLDTSLHGTEAAKANTEIRFFQVHYLCGAEPWPDLKHGQWRQFDGTAELKFSGIAVFFAQKLYSELKIPIGIIGSYWGGTIAECWTPPEGFAMVPELSHLRSQFPPINVTGHPTEAMELYNSMIHPLTPYALRGILWYQGEGNVVQRENYIYRLQALHRGWKKAFQHPNLPFYIVQLPFFKYGYDSAPERQFSLSRFMAAQAAYADQEENAHITIITDVSDLDDIHPKNKKPVGERLANQALVYEYGYQDRICNGARVIKISREGKVIKLEFNHELLTVDGKNPDCFEIAGPDRIYQTAQTAIQENGITLQANNLPEPLFVRFAWHETSQPNLRSAGLPVSPFSMSCLPTN